MTRRLGIPASGSIRQISYFADYPVSRDVLFVESATDSGLAHTLKPLVVSHHTMLL
jgi:hypothetical protein